MMKMEILIHELLHMFEKQVLMLSGFYLLQVMMDQEERGLLMVVILEMMVGILQIHNKVNIH